MTARLIREFVRTNVNTEADPEYTKEASQSEPFSPPVQGAFLIAVDWQSNPGLVAVTWLVEE